MAEKITILNNRDKAELEEQIAAAGSKPSAPVTGGSTVKIVSKTYGSDEFQGSVYMHGDGSIEFTVSKIPSNTIVVDVRFKHDGAILTATDLYAGGLLVSNNVVRIPSTPNFSTMDKVYVLVQISNCAQTDPLYSQYVIDANPITEIIVDYLYFGNDEEADFA